jgi:AraC-like DNA-binding protein
MRRSSFHAHFKSVTAMSPLEFRAQLRKREARSRLFGMPPATDAQRLRLADA